MKKIMLAILLLFCLISVSTANTEFIQAPYSFQRWMADLKVSSTIPVNIYVYELHVGTFVCIDSFTATTGNFLQDLWVRGETVLTNTTIGGLLKATSFYFADGTFPIKTDALLLTPKERVGSSYIVLYSSDETNSQPYSDVTISVNFASPSTNEFTIRYGDRIKLISNANLDYFAYDSSTRKFKISNENNPALAGGLEVSTTGQFGSVITNEVHWPDGSVSTTSASGLLGGYVLKIGDHMTGDLINDTTFQAHTGNFEEVLTSTIIGKHSPVYAPDGFRLADGTILNSTIVPTGFTSSSTARIPTVYVCASDSPAELKATAQYVCDGVNDEVDIQNALTYLNGISGGKLQLEKGNYNLADSGFPISVYSNTTISGQGQSTILNLSYAGVATLFTLSGVSNVMIENLLFNPLTYSLGDFMVSASGNNVRIKNNVFNTCSMGVYFTSGSSNCYVSDNIFRFNDIGGYGIYFNGTVGSACGNINITGNHIFGTSLKPIHLTNVENSFVIGNTMENSASGSDGEINIDNCINIVVKGNIIRPTDYTLIGRGINVNSGSTRISVEGNIVTQRDYGFYVIGTSCTITGNIAYDCNIANALINVFTNKEDVNSWDSDNAKQSDLTATQISTGTETVARIAGDVAIGGTTNYLYQQIQSTRAACVAGDIAIGISTAAEASTRASGDSLLGAATGQIAASVAVSSATEALARQAADEVIGGTTSYLYQQIQSTRAACLAGDIAIGLSTATEASTRAAADSALGVTTGTLNTAISTTAVMAFSVSTSAVRTGVDGDILATTGKVDIGTEEYSLIYTTYTLDMPIALSSNTETGDFGEFESASSFTVIDVFFTSRTTAPISNVTFTCQRQTSGNNIMNGSMLLTGGLTQSTVFVSTNVIPAMDGIRVIATGRSNGIVHAVFRVFKKRGQ